MAGTLFRYEFQVLESHLDTFGHVNHATYLTLFEQARWDFVTKNGFGLAEVQARKNGPIILEVHVRYQKELRLREKVTIESKVQTHSGKIAKLTQRMVNESGDLACTADFSIGFFNMERRKLIHPTPEWLKAIGIGL